MMSDVLLTEELVPLDEAVQFWPGTGKRRPHKCTWGRWANPKKGCRGVVLESVLLAGERHTSRQAIARFLAAVSVAEPRAGLGQAANGRELAAAADKAPPADEPPAIRGRRERQRAIRQAQERLSEAGL